MGHAGLTQPLTSRITNDSAAQHSPRRRLLRLRRVHTPHSRIKKAGTTARSSRKRSVRSHRRGSAAGKNSPIS